MSVVLDPEEILQDGAMSFDQGNFDAGITAYRQAATVYARQGKHQLAGFALATLGLRSESAPNCLSEALSAYEAASKAFREAGRLRESTDALFSAGIAAKKGNLDGLAMKLLLQAAEEYRLLAAKCSESNSEIEVRSLYGLAAEAQKQAGQSMAVTAS